METILNDSTNWGDEANKINRNNGRLSANSNNIINTSGYYTLSQGVGNVISTAINADSLSRCGNVSCEEGEKFFVKSLGGISSRAWCFVDSSNIILSVADANLNVYDNPIVIEAPANASKLYVNCKIISGSSAYLFEDSIVIRASDIFAQLNYDIAKKEYDKSVVINDALNQTAASAVHMAFDEENGLIGASYMAGANGSYGEQGGWIQLAVFSPAQPTNVRYIDVSTESQAYEPNVIYIGSGVFRVFYIIFGKTSNYVYKDYDAVNNTISSASNVKIDIDNTLYNVTRSVIDSYLASQGYTDYADESYPIIMTTRFTEYDSKKWGTLSCSGGYYPVVFSTTDNGATLTPENIIPFRAYYECQIEWNNDIMHTLVRSSSNIKYMKYAGGTWSSTTDILDSVSSRPMIINYKTGVLIALTIAATKDDYFPDLNGNRRGLLLLYGDDSIANPNSWERLFKMTSKYGFLYSFPVVIYDDIYLGYSDAQLMLKVQNGITTTDDGKECIKFKKLTL